MTHYINGNLPALAVRAITRHSGVRLPSDVHEGLLARLRSAGLHESAGELLQHLQRPQEALDAYAQCAPDSLPRCASAELVHALHTFESAAASTCLDRAQLSFCLLTIQTHSAIQASALELYAAMLVYNCRSGLPHSCQMFVRACRAGAYARAVQLATDNAELGGAIVPLHAAWATQLVSTGAPDAAISHFVEAGDAAAAARAALSADSLSRAAALVDTLEHDEQEALAGELAARYNAAGNRGQAAAFFVRAGRPTAAVHMYLDAGLWEEAHKVCCRARLS